LANHYAHSNAQNESIEYFLTSEMLLGYEVPSDFWEEYAFATALANMPSHSIYGMQQAKKILGHPGYFENQLGDAIKNRIEPIDASSTYEMEDIWNASIDETNTFICRPLGLKVLVDSTWNMQFSDYENNQSYVLIVPPEISNESGRKISYSIMIMMKVVDDSADIDEYGARFFGGFADQNEFEMEVKYGGMRSMEMRDPEMYQDIGGGHFHTIVFERNYPEFPGLLLEEPVEIKSSGKKKKVQYYRAGSSKDRFNSRIFYAVMLDTCEDIYDESFSLFKHFFDNNIIIE
jgi:hypothetical protein